MKNLMLLLALICCQFVEAATYYFSVLNGDDLRSSVQAQNPLTPWKSLTRLNAFISSLQPGDSILFNRGEIFPGQIRVTQSGSSSSRITFGAYGSGNDPVISGFYTLTSWTNTGNGIWEAICNSCGNNVNTVNIDGSNRAMGRFPNADAPNKGYLKFESHSGITQITDNELINAPNWNGSEVVIRKNYWTLDRNYVTQHNNGTITFISPTGHPLLDGYGYFFQRHLQTLDRSGEWFYDAVQKKMKVFFGAGGPGSALTRVGIVDTLVVIASKNNISFINLAFEGADTTAFAINDAVNIRLQNCRFNASGIDGVNARNSDQVVVESCVFDQTNNNAIRITDCNFSEVRNSSIRNTGLMAGMGLSNNQMYEAIYTRGSSNTVENNEVINTGYSAITFSGERAVVRNNFIENYTMVLDDGGGIYGWGDYDKPARVISNNIILNGTGAPEGTDVNIPGNSSGIYLDDRSANVEITGNTVSNANRAGIYLHNSHEIVLKNNTLFNNGSQVAMVHDDLEPADPIRNVTMQNNIFFSKTDAQSAAIFASRLDDIASFGVFSSNYYARPIDPHGIIQTDHRNSAGQYINLRHSLPAWKSLYSNDAGSLPAPVGIVPHLIQSFIGGNRFSNGSFNANINGVFCMSSPGSCATSWNGGGRLDGGALEIRATGGATNISTHVSIGSVQAGKKYLIKFSLLGSLPFQTVGAYLLKNSAPYNALSEKKYFSLSNTRTENEFVFSSNTSESDVYLIFTINNAQQPFWVDNIDVREVNASITNPEDHLRFEYNRTGTPRTVVLDAAYIDVKNNSYLNTITLAPFSSAVLLRTGAVLPIKIFDVQVQNRSLFNQLNWTATNEEDIDHYEIQRSHNNASYQSIGKSLKMAGISAHSYRFNDSNARRGTNCYRIKAIGKNGSYFYSSIDCITDSRVATARIYPNPVINELEIFWDDINSTQKTELVIRDSRGSTVLNNRVSIRNGKIKADVSALTAGVYFIYLRSGNSVLTEKFVKYGR